MRACMTRKFGGLLQEANTSADLYADSRIVRWSRPKQNLSKAKEDANHQKSKVRARVGHVFGAQHVEGCEHNVCKTPNNGVKVRTGFGRAGEVSTALFRHM